MRSGCAESAALAFLAAVAAIAWSIPCDAQLTPAEADQLLANHNDVRAGVLPTAANMTRLAWDPDLATVAQGWADQCNFAHNAGRSAQYAALSPNPGGVGENVYLTQGSRASAIDGANSAVSLWASEAVDYDFATNSCAPGQVCGHYTQVAWANTRRVGCGIEFCPTVTGAPGFDNSHLVVCDYNPAGNFVGQSPYLAGAPGSQCPPDLPLFVEGLCSAAVPVPALPGALAVAVGIALGALGVAQSRRRFRHRSSRRSGSR